MKTVIYINNDCIQIVYGQSTQNGIKIKSKESVLLEEGTILNGVIIDSEELVAKLFPLRTKLKNVTVLIDNSNISVKRITTPKLKKNQMQNVVKNEFGFPLDDDTFLYDVNLYEENTENVAICCAVSRDLVDNYISVFKEAKISIKKIDVAVNAIIKFVELNEELHNKTFVLNIVSNNSMLSVLFEGGKYLLTNRNRLMNEDDTEEYLAEIVTKLSSMIQFNKSEKSVFNIHSSYYLGLDEETILEMEDYANRLEMGIEILGVEDFTYSADVEYIYPSMEMAETKKDINLYKVIRDIEIAKLDLDKKIKIFACVFFVCAIVFGNYGKIRYNNYILQKEIEEYNEFFVGADSEEIQNEFEETSDARQERLDHIYGVVLSLEHVDRENNLTKAKIETIDQEMTDKIELELLKYTDQVITLSGKSNGELESAKFVHRLKATNLFTNVSYTGYDITEDVDSYVVDENGNIVQVNTDNYKEPYQGEFSFTIEATLKAGGYKND